MKAKINSYDVKMNVGFHNNRVVKSWPCSCSLVMLIDSVFRTKESYYPQVFLEEYEYVVKENKMCIDEEIEISSDESDE